MNGLEDVLEAETGLANVLNQDAEGFYYPIEKLWNPEKKEFGLKLDFIEDSSNHCIQHTQSQEQNEVVEILEQICDGLNKLARLNLLRPQHGSMEINQLQDWIKINGGAMSHSPTSVHAQVKENTTPFTIEQHIFRRHRMDKFRIKGIPESVYRKKETLFNAINIDSSNGRLIK